MKRKFHRALSVPEKEQRNHGNGNLQSDGKMQKASYLARANLANYSR